MTQKERIEAFAQLGIFLNTLANSEDEIFNIVANRNPWYTANNVKQQLNAISHNLLLEKLDKWLLPYTFHSTDKTVGIILAGNIPLVGFSDILAVLISGFKATIKVSSDDAGLTKLVLDQLLKIQPAFADKIEIVERLSTFDLIIATGSDNSSRYFDYYFSKKPNIIRRNRNSVAILDGSENPEELSNLGHDIFDYFGLGCRSVSKLFIPHNYPIAHFFEGIESFNAIRNHYKYNNNYDYNKSIYLINGDQHYDNGFLLLKQDERTASPLAVVYYEEYNSTDELTAKINSQANALQCLISKNKLVTNVAQYSFGASQHPSLTDYADNIDTLKFLEENQ